ncbi:MAG: hypothetical protein ACRDNL_08760, partial [Spirillospora sp.]
EQWTNATEQARHVARNLFADRPAEHPFRGSNYFWSDRYGVRIQSAGIADADEIRVVDGSMNFPRHLVQAKRLIEQSTTWTTALGRWTG